MACDCGAPMAMGGWFSSLGWAWLSIWAEVRPIECGVVFAAPAWVEGGADNWGAGF